MDELSTLFPNCNEKLHSEVFCLTKPSASELLLRNSEVFCSNDISIVALHCDLLEYDTCDNDQNVKMIIQWRWWWLGCWCSSSLRAGLGPGTGLGFCLWLSFTQIAESCLWEPKDFGAQGSQGESLVGQRSYLALFASEAASGWGLWPLLGTGQYLGVHGCSHFSRCWCFLYWFTILCS